jgi:hypothetical protein
VPSRRDTRSQAVGDGCPGRDGTASCFVRGVRGLDDRMFWDPLPENVERPLAPPDSPPGRPPKSSKRQGQNGAR